MLLRWRVPRCSPRNCNPLRTARLAPGSRSGVSAALMLGAELLHLSAHVIGSPALTASFGVRSVFVRWRAHENRDCRLKWACGVSAYGFASARWAHCSAAAAHRERHTKREWQRRSKPNTKSDYGAAEQFGKDYRRHVESEYVRPGRRTVRRGPGKNRRFGCFGEFGRRLHSRGKLEQGTQSGVAFEPRAHHP